MCAEVAAPPTQPGAAVLRHSAGLKDVAQELHWTPNALYKTLYSPHIARMRRNSLETKIDMSLARLRNNTQWWALVEASCDGARQNEFREIEPLIADERFRLLYAAYMDLIAQLRYYETEAVAGGTAGRCARLVSSD